MGQPQPLFCLFLSFQTNIAILKTNKCEKCPSCIWFWDQNSQPPDYESTPLTTRPGLPSIYKMFIQGTFTYFVSKSFTVWLVSSLTRLDSTIQENMILNKWAIPGLFFFIFVFSTQLTVNKCQIKVCQCLDLNRGSLVLKASALPLNHNHCKEKMILFAYFKATESNLMIPHS